jgi:hypothetical protein
METTARGVLVASPKTRYVAGANFSALSKVKSKMSTQNFDLNAWRAYCSAEYLAAYDCHAKAARKYDVAVKAYRARKIGDAAYLAAREEYDREVKLFDLAFATEQKNAESVRNR